MTYKYLLKGIFASLLIVSSLLLLLTQCISSDKYKPPEVVYKLGDGEGSLVRLPDGNFMLFRMDGKNLVSIVSSDGHIWSKPKVEISGRKVIDVTLAENVASENLKVLSKMYLFVHGLSWLDIIPSDPRRETKEWECWPGRCESAYQYELGLKLKYYQLIEKVSKEENTGIFFLPNGFKENTKFINYSQKLFGLRSVNCDMVNKGILGDEFTKSSEEDMKQAKANKLTEGAIGAWSRSKIWATYLKKQLENQGYTFDPATVEFIAFGEDWGGCAATYPIHMGRAFGLKNPIERRFDLINPDESKMRLKLIPVIQNVEMPEGIRLFIFKTYDDYYVAEYWEGLYGITDDHHIISTEFEKKWAEAIPAERCLDFPEDSVIIVNLDRNPIKEKKYGQVTMKVGAGSHTSYSPTIIRAEKSLSLVDFYNVLKNGKVERVRDKQ